MEGQVLSPGFQLQDGKYKILGLLGQGGFGITYEAEQVSLGRKVAIKEFFMKDICERADDTASITVPTKNNRPLVDKFKDKFIREARLIAAMDNPHIVKIYDVFEENGTAYYVMESIQGGSLSTLVKTEGPLPEDIAIEYIKQIGEALTYIHGQNVLHLDVKPSNILIRKNKTNDAVLIDFGISKHYDEAGQQTSSTPIGISEGYAPIEQYRSGDISIFKPTTDVYSLGATLYYLVSGDVPPAASDVLALGLKRPLLVSDLVWNAISSAMQPKPVDRPQSVMAFLSLLSGKPIVAASKPAPVFGEGTVLNEISPLASLGRNDKSPAGHFPVIAGSDRQSPKSKKTTWIAVAVAAVVALLVGIFVIGGGKTPSDTPVVQDTTSIAQTVVDPSTPEPAKPAPPVTEDTFEIIVSSTPSGAKVFINGKDQRETTPATIKDLKAGTYKVTLKMDGYEEQSKTVTFKKGGTLYSKVSLSLNKEAEPAPQPVQPVATTSGTGTINGHEWVDLGLSVKWATTNVGASTPGDYGNYYAWAETSPKSSYDLPNLRDYSGNGKFSKYNTQSDRGPVDNKTRLDLSDDAARQNWGGSWRMPTDDEWTELRTKCTLTWTTQNGNKGYKVTANNGRSIFLPAAGYGGRTGLYDAGSFGYYWSSSLDAVSPRFAWGVYFYSTEVSRSSSVRYRGRSVRPVSE